jgi:hypothetical protein
MLRHKHGRSRTRIIFAAMMLCGSIFGALHCGSSSDGDAGPEGSDASSTTGDGSLDSGATVDSSTDAAITDGAAPITCAKQTLPSDVTSIGYVSNVFCDDFSDLSTIDLANTQTPGFNWYIENVSEGSSPNPANFTTVHAGPITAVRLAGSGTSMQGSSVTKGARDPIGISFGQHKNGGAYFEANIAMRMPDAGNAWPAFWASSTLHQQGKTVTWAGQPNAAYEHYIEVDFMELMNSTSGDYRSTIIDWFGQWQTPTATCDSGTYCKVQNSQLLGPGVLGTFDSTEAAPKFHRYGCLWIPSVQTDDAGPYSQGSIEWFIDGASTGTKVTWVGPPSTTVLDFASPEAWKYAVIDQEQLSIILDTASNAFMDVDYVGVWQLP